MAKPVTREDIARMVDVYKWSLYDSCMAKASVALSEKEAASLRETAEFHVRRSLEIADNILSLLESREAEGSGRVAVRPGSTRDAPEAPTGLRPSGDDPSRGLAPRPNFQTKATFADAIEWAIAVEDGRWSWVRNTRCKYVTLRFDTRSGVHWISDRDGHEITLADLRRQYRSDSDGSPKGGDGEAGSVHDSAGPKGIAQSLSPIPSNEEKD